MNKMEHERPNTNSPNSIASIFNHLQSSNFRPSPLYHDKVISKSITGPKSLRLISYEAMTSLIIEYIPNDLKCEREREKEQSSIFHVGLLSNMLSA